MTTWNDIENMETEFDRFIDGLTENERGFLDMCTDEQYDAFMTVRGR